MSDGNNEITPVPGIPRRDFVKKSAILGGMVWAAPAVTTLGSRAFADGSDFGGDSDCVRYFQFKIDELDGSPKVECPGPDSRGSCFPEHWNHEHDDDPAYTCLDGGGVWDSNARTFTVALPSGHGSVTLNIPSDRRSAVLTLNDAPACRILVGDAKVGGGLSGDQCQELVENDDGDFTISDTSFGISNMTVVICCTE